MTRVLIPLDLPPVVPVAPNGSAGICTLDGETMGTTWSVKFIGSPDGPLDELRAGIQHVLDVVVQQMSTWLADSDLSRYNQAPAGTVHQLPEEFFQVLEYALSMARDSGGAYDPTVGPLVNLWGFGPHARRTHPPKPEEIEALRARCGWERVRLDREARQIWQPGDVYLDLSAVAKGFGVDQVAYYLLRQKITSYLVEVGGELRGLGMKPDGDPWWVALERPLPPDNKDCIVALHGMSIATSGDYRRYFEDKGQRYSHTIDPRTGYPVTHQAASVTVLHRECMVADVLSTALTVLGPEERMKYAQRHQVAALFIDRHESGFTEEMTPAFIAMLN